MIPLNPDSDKWLVTFCFWTLKYRDIGLYALCTEEYSVYICRVPYGTRNGGLPICIWGWGLCSNGHGRDTTRITIQLAFWQLSDNVILIMFGTS
jgi:hypothetical protein